MSGCYRRRRPPSTVARGASRAVVLERTAKLVRAEMRRCQIDLAPAPTLAAMLGVTLDTLRDAVSGDPELGICGPAGHPIVWSLPHGPLGAGFEPVLARGRLALVLPGSVSNPHPLVLSGRQLGGNCEGTGELSQTIIRIFRMAERWIILDPAPVTASARCRRLFELIARTWRSCPSVQWPGDRLRIYQAEHGAPVATRADGASTDQLELVVWTGDDGRHQLVNVSPGGATCAVIGLETLS